MMILIYLLFALHWSIWLFTSFYGLIRKSKSLDWFYFAIVACVLYGWFLNRNECIISLVEKLIYDCDYKRGSLPSHHPSLLIYDDSFFSLLLLLCFTILQIISFVIVCNDYIKSKLTIFFIAITAYLICIYYFFKHLHVTLVK